VSNVVSLAESKSAIKAGGRWAPLNNVTLANRAVERLLNRERNLPGIGVLSGRSGVGKSMALAYCANKHEGVYVEVRSYMTKKVFVEAILREMGIRAGRTIAEMMAQVAEQLDLSQRPLMIDEADYLVTRNMIEIVRDLHEMSRASILLVGEENFPNALKRHSERFHNRVLVWTAAQALNVADARHLAAFYVPGVDVEQDLIDAARQHSRDVARVFCCNLDAVREHCEKEGLKRIDLGLWGKRGFFTGDAPRVGK
jgi:hypothetical protein